MKKIFLLAALAIAGTSAQAQRITDLTIMDGETPVIPLSKCGRTNPKNNKETAGVIQMVFKADQQFGNLTVTPTMTDCALDAATPMPTDFTNKVTGLKVNSTKEGSTDYAYYEIEFKHINPIDIPENGLTYAWTSAEEGNGWAGSQFSPGSDGGTSGSLGMQDRGLVLAFNNAATLAYSIKVTAEWTNEIGTAATVETSEDGVTWQALATYNDANPLSQELKAENFEVASTVKYARFIYTCKPSAYKGNISIDKVKLTKATETDPSSIRNAAAEGMTASVVDGRLVVSSNVAKAEVYDIAGKAVNAESLGNGLYLVRLTAADGSVATSKVLVK